MNTETGKIYSGQDMMEAQFRGEPLAYLSEGIFNDLRRLDTGPASRGISKGRSKTFRQKRAKPGRKGSGRSR